MNKHYFRALARDVGNRVRFGSGAPKYGERIYIEVGQSEEYLPSRAVETLFGYRLRQASALVVCDWSSETRPITAHDKIRICLRHWRDGLTWDAAGGYDYMMHRIRNSPSGRFDGCANLEDVRKRYERLDQLFMELQNGGSFATMRHLHPGNFREVGGVIFHIGPKGEPVFGGGGAHRFALAKALDLTIPAQIGVVHKAAIPVLHRYRQQS